MLTLLATSPRVAPGILTWRAWDSLRSAARVLTGSADHPQAPYLREAGVTVDVAEPDAGSVLAAIATASGDVIWLAALDGDEQLFRAIGAIVVGMDEPPVIEVLHGSYDLPGAKLLDVVTVMDTLRRECPWDREQTHLSLVRYLLEEAYEVAETVEDGDLTALREELGDVLMQVAFHSVVASERTDDARFTIDDVAAGIVEKLIRRHPHVFGSVTVDGADQVSSNWESIKRSERGDDASVFAGVPMGQPALMLAAQLQRRAAQASVPEDLFNASAPGSIGADLFAVVRRAREADLDPEAELRAQAREFRDRVQTWEATP